MRYSLLTAAVLASLGLTASRGLADVQTLTPIQLEPAANSQSVFGQASPFSQWIKAGEVGVQLTGYAGQEVAWANSAAVSDADEQVPPPKPDGSMMDGSLSGDGCCAPSGCCPPAAPCCPANIGGHQTGFFGEYLLLRARNADVAYTQPRNGLGPTSVPIGTVDTLNPQYSSGFRLGGALAIDPCSSFVSTFSWWQSETTGSAAVNVPDSLRSLTFYPGTASAAANSLSANAGYAIRFRMADFDYRRLILGNSNRSINWFAGLRYAHLGQNFSANELITPGTTNTTSNINFDGAGLRVGADGARRAWNSGFMIYGRTSANFVAGSFRANYAQTNTFIGPEAASGWKDQRIVSILEAELGAGWVSRSGNIRITGGYFMASWFNTLTQPVWLQSAKTDNFTNMGSTLTFDGFTGRVELLY